MAGDIRLRDVCDADLAIFYDQQLDAEANWMAAFTAKHPANREAFDAHWKKIRSDPAITIRTIVVEDSVAGHVLSFDQSGERDVSYWIGKEYWGRGIATAALSLYLKQVTERPIFARVAKDNSRSIRVLEKCGFERCGEGEWFSNARDVLLPEFVFKLEK